MISGVEAIYTVFHSCENAMALVCVFSISGYLDKMILKTKRANER